jgi:hypothetical protein
MVATAVGAKTSLLAVCDGDAREILRARPPLDRDAAKRFAEQLTGHALESIEDGTLGEGTNPPDGVVYAASYPGLDLLCDASLARDRPSELPARYTRASQRRVILHAMHSVVDWFAFGVWERGTLVRALSVSPDDGVIEDIGARLPFELPFWAGEHPVDDEHDEDGYPLAFHPLELGEEALHAFFGFRLEGAPTEIDPFDVSLAGFSMRRPRLVGKVLGWLTRS